MRALVADGDEGQRLDVFVAKLTEGSRSQAGSLIDDGYVTVNTQAQRKAYKVAAGDVVEVRSRVETVRPPPRGVDVVYDDDDLLVVSKPSGVVVHAAPGLREATLVDALTAQGHPLAERAGAERPGIVHRLDRDVSGLLIVAKTDVAHKRLVDAMKRRTIERRYVALVNGVPQTDRGKIDAPIGRDTKHKTRMAVTPGGRPAVTWFSVIERLAGCSLLDVRLETGRTHQIRTHLASIGHPVVGDAAYGRDPALAKRLGLGRLFLHAARLAFDHPVSGRHLTFESTLPDELATALQKARSA